MGEKVTLHASIAKAAVEAEVVFNVPSAPAYVSTTLSADSVVVAVVLATVSLHKLHRPAWVQPCNTNTADENPCVVGHPNQSLA